jgi:hypothetical protein
VPGTHLAELRRGAGRPSRPTCRHRPDQPPAHAAQVSRQPSPSRRSQTDRHRGATGASAKGVARRRGASPASADARAALVNLDRVTAVLVNLDRMHGPPTCPSSPGRARSIASGSRLAISSSSSSSSVSSPSSRGPAPPIAACRASSSSCRSRASRQRENGASPPPCPRTHTQTNLSEIALIVKLDSQS